MHEVINSTTFREELRVVENLELGVGTVKLELFTRGERQYQSEDRGSFLFFLRIFKGGALGARMGSNTAEPSRYISLSMTSFSQWHRSN
jgi:hypothetical protein